MNAYRGPTLITAPELRWPIVLLAAAITALLAILTAGLYYVAMTQSTVKSDTQPRLEQALQLGQPEFEEFRRHIDKDSDRAHLVLEVTAMRFDES